jgi:hypothetical protein
MGGSYELKIKMLSFSDKKLIKKISVIPLLLYSLQILHSILQLFYNQNENYISEHEEWQAGRQAT